MRLEQLLNASATRVGHKAAIVAGRAAHSYAELDRKTDRFAAALADRGIKRGDRIAVLLDTGFAAVVTTFGVLKAGATLCPADPAIDASSLARFLNESGATGIVTEARLASKAAIALAETSAVRLVVLVGGDRSAAAGNCLSFEDIVGRIEGAVPMPAGGDKDPAIVLPTADAGHHLETFTHSEIVLASSAVAAHEDAVTVAPVSIASQPGLGQLVAAIGVGATLILAGSAGRSVFARDDFAEARLALA